MINQYLLRLRFPIALMIAAVALLGAVHLGGWRTAAAQDNSGAAADPASVTVTSTAAAGTVTANDVNNVARELWCPLCSGVRLDACELKACAQMKDVIGQKLASGEDVSSIKNYFVAQYGPQVLGEPPMEGFNWLAWILPVLALLGGGVFVWTRVRNSTRRTQTGQAAEVPAPAAGDAYSQKLDEELKHYD